MALDGTVGESRFSQCGDLGHHRTHGSEVNRNECTIHNTQYTPPSIEIIGDLHPSPLIELKGFDVIVEPPNAESNSAL